MDKRGPLERMIDATVRCTKCGTQGVGNCDCWPETPKQAAPEVAYHGVASREAIEAMGLVLGPDSEETTLPFGITDPALNDGPLLPRARKPRKRRRK